MFDAIIAVIWVAFMIIAAVNAVIKKKKQQEEMQARASTGEETAAELKPVYTAREEDIRSFLEEIGAKPKPASQPEPAAIQPQQPTPAQQSERSSWDKRHETLVEAKARRKKAHSSRSKPSPPAKVPKLSPARSVWDEVDDASRVPVLSAENDPVAALTKRLSPIQRAVIWREILDTPPGLRAGVPARE